MATAIHAVKAWIAQTILDHRPNRTALNRITLKLREFDQPSGCVVIPPRLEKRG